MSQHFEEKNPFHIIKSRHITEKSLMLQELHRSESNACVKKCQTPKYVFLVDKKATKTQIASAIEQIYAEKKVKVVGVNTITIKAKPKRVRGLAKYGKGPAIKKAIVSLDVGDIIEN